MTKYQPQNYMAYRRKSAVLSNSQDHLWGIRAILAVQSFAWLFFKVFNPALTVPGPTTTGEHVPSAAPSTVPGVFGGPGIVAPGAGSGIVARDLYSGDLYSRDLYRRNLSMLIPFLCYFQIKEVARGASGSGQRRQTRNLFGKTSATCTQASCLTTSSEASHNLGASHGSILECLACGTCQT